MRNATRQLLAKIDAGLETAVLGVSQTFGKKGEEKVKDDYFMASDFFTRRLGAGVPDEALAVRAMVRDMMRVLWIQLVTAATLKKGGNESDAQFASRQQAKFGQAWQATLFALARLSPSLGQHHLNLRVKALAEAGDAKHKALADLCSVLAIKDSRDNPQPLTLVADASGRLHIERVEDAAARLLRATVRHPNSMMNATVNEYRKVLVNAGCIENEASKAAIVEERKLVREEAAAAQAKADAEVRAAFEAAAAKAAEADAKRAAAQADGKKPGEGFGGIDLQAATAGSDADGPMAAALRAAAERQKSA